MFLILGQLILSTAFAGPKHPDNVVGVEEAREAMYAESARLLEIRYDDGQKLVTGLNIAYCNAKTSQIVKYTSKIDLVACVEIRTATDTDAEFVNSFYPNGTKIEGVYFWVTSGFNPEPQPSMTAGK